MNHSELLWKYIDGQCAPEEAARVEKLLAEDPAFRREWAQRHKLHQHLRLEEPEQPSMRFTRNVMDRLPNLYRKLNIRPLVSPFWQKALGALAGAFLLAYFALVFNVVETAGPGSSNPNPQIQGFVDTLTSLPMQAMSILLSLSFGYILLTLVDRKLKKRFSRSSLRAD